MEELDGQDGEELEEVRKHNIQIGGQPMTGLESSIAFNKEDQMN